MSRALYKHRRLADGPYTYDGYATSIHEYLFPHKQSVYVRVLDDFNHWLEASKYPTMAQATNLELLEADNSGILICITGVRRMLYEPKEWDAFIARRNELKVRYV